MKNLSDINVIKSVMGKHGVTFNKGLGQNFLVDPEVCPAMAEAAGDMNKAFEFKIKIGAVENMFSIWEAWRVDNDVYPDMVRGNKK